LAATKLCSVRVFIAPNSETQYFEQLIIWTINYCIRNGHILKRWKTIVNVMIFKDPGVVKIHRLHVIHIYAADFNFLLAVKWRKLLHAADAPGLLNEGQFGGRPGCEAQFLTLLEELKYNISYLSRRSLFNFDNNALSCYDWIILALASLVNQKYGQHRQVTPPSSPHARQNSGRSAISALPHSNPVSNQILTLYPIPLIWQRPRQR
jgi:hypothetical protein